MNKMVYQLNARHLAFQRNAFLGISFFLSIAVVVMTTMFFLKNERLVIVPHALSEKIWIEGNKVSGSYLKQQALIVSMLFLSKTPSSAREQNEALLEITSPSLYGDLKVKLNKEKQFLIDQGTTYLFVPSKISVKESSMIVEVEGDRSTYSAGKLISTLKEKYSYAFVFTGRKLLLDSIQREEILV